MNYTLITGASAGIGEATARLFAQNGRNLILIARRLEKLEDLKKELSESGVDIQVFSVDVSSREQVDAFIDQIKDLPVDVLVNNAGLAIGKGGLHEYEDPDDFQKIIDVNISGVTYFAHKILPKLIETQGDLVNVSSIAGRSAYRGSPVYCGSKAYVAHISKCIRKDVLDKKVRVMDVSPGATETEFSLVRFKGDRQKAAERYADFQPLAPEDVADAIWYCASRPKHVCIDSIEVMATAQAGVGDTYKEE